MKKICFIFGSGATCGSGYKIKGSKEDGFFSNNSINNAPPTDQGFFPALNLDNEKYPALGILTEEFKTKSMEATMVLIEAGYFLQSGQSDQLDESFDKWLEKTIKKNRDEFHQAIIALNLKYKGSNKRASFNGNCEEKEQFQLTGDAQREMWHLIWMLYGKRIQLPNNGVDNFKQLFSKIKKKEYQFSVITFNYDLLAENNLEQYTYVGCDGVRSHAENLPVVAKLHGSLSWQEKCEKGKQPEVVFLGDVIPEIDYTGKAGLDYVQPAIVAPTFTKSEITDAGNNPIRKIIRAQWEYAKHLLDWADHWIFVGYSFPETDTHAEKLFREIKTKKNRRFFAIYKDKDKDNELEKRFKEIVGKSIEFNHDGFDNKALKALIDWLG